MKNLFNYKTVLVLAGTLVFATSCDENRSTESGEVVEQENLENDGMADNGIDNDGETALILDNNDPTVFLTKVAEMQLMEIQLGQLAQQKGTSAHVKELGKMMESDHSKTLEEVKQMAQTKTVTIPTTATEDAMDSYEKLGEETGADFDKEYSDMMVDHHEKAIKLFEEAAEDSEDAEIKSWASSKLAGLRTHLGHAKAAKEQSDKVN